MKNRPHIFSSNEDKINKLKNFKKLKRIHEFFISYGTYSEEEYKEATKNIQIDKVEIEETLKNKKGKR